jgi:hypothetical protein
MCLIETPAGVTTGWSAFAISKVAMWVVYMFMVVSLPE